MKRLFIGLIFGLLVGAIIGFAAGVYTLPILVDARNESQQQEPLPTFQPADPSGQFDRNHPGSDALHWGTGTVRISGNKLIFEDDVEFSPGPDYRVYLSKRYVESKEEFLPIKAEAVEVAKLKTFSGPLSFDLPEELDIALYDNIVVWCEAFSMFITSSRLE